MYNTFEHSIKLIIKAQFLLPSSFVINEREAKQSEKDLTCTDIQKPNYPGRRESRGNNLWKISSRSRPKPEHWTFSTRNRRTTRRRVSQRTSLSSSSSSSPCPSSSCSSCLYYRSLRMQKKIPAAQTASLGVVHPLSPLAVVIEVAQV